MFFLFAALPNLVTATIWIEPSKDLDYYCNQNQAFIEEQGNSYYRLPPRAQKIVRARIWQLSRLSASISIKFITNSTKIQIEYQRPGSFNFAMMNQLGTSGIDLYGYDENGKLYFFQGTYNFDSKTTFNFQQKNKSAMFTYLLILPSYDEVKPSTLKIGFDDQSYFHIFETELERPITLYGTSIMHGACPNRPGLSWVNWMSRDLQLPVHNFGFMGQGILEKEIINLIIEEECQVFILDCLPNLVFETIEKVVNLTIESYFQIREKWPNTPIVLVEFGGYTNYEFSDEYKTYTDNMNEASKIALQKLIELNASNLFYIYQEEIGMTSDDISDPVHPMDNGMKKQKDAVVRKLREVLKMPSSGNFSTQKAVSQHRNINFFNAHQENIKKIRNKNLNINKAIIGDSMVYRWQTVGKDSWSQYMENKGFVNLGIELDRIENVLYRVYRDEMSNIDIQHQKIIVSIGSNNLHINNATEIVEGIRFLMHRIADRQPSANLILLGIFPKSGFEEKVAEINVQLKNMADVEGWTFSNYPGQSLVDEKTGLINNKYFVDGVNLNKEGYDLIAPLISDL